MPRNSHPTRTDLELAIENLEQRRMLAGSVEATVAGKSLTVDGDGQDNFVVVAQYNDQLAVIGIDTEVADADYSDSFFGIDIDVKLIDGVSKDVNILLRGGDDIALVGGSIQEGSEPEEEVDVLAALDEYGLSFEALTLPRDLNIATHGGRDIIVVAGTEVSRDLTIDSGFGLEDIVVVGGGGVAMAALDNADEILDFLDLAPSASLEFNGGFEIDGILEELASVVLGEVTVGRDMEINGYTSFDSIYVGGVDVGRDADIFTGVGDDNLYLGVGGTVEIFVPWYGDDNGDGDGDGDGDGGDPRVNELSIPYFPGINAHVNVGRDATIWSGDQDDLTRIGGSQDYFLTLPPIDVVVEQNIDVDFGYYFYIDIYGGVDVGRDLDVDAGNNDDSTFIAVNPGRFGNGEPAIAARESDFGKANVNVGRHMEVDMGEDDDFLQIGGSEYDAYIDADQYYVEVSQALEVGKNLDISMGAGNDELLMGQQDPILIYYYPTGALAEGSDHGAFQIKVGKNFDLATWTHDDIVSIAGHAYLHQYENGGFGSSSQSIGTLYVGKNMDVDTDGGNDVFELGQTSAHDNDEFGDVSNSSAIVIEGDLNIETGNQDDLVALDTLWVGDDTSIDTFWGRDEVRIGGTYQSYYKSYSVSIGDRLTIETSLERDTVDIYNTYVGGKTKIDTGIRDDSVTIEYSTFDNDVTLLLDRGNDTVELYDVQVDDLKIKTDAEDDEIYLNYVYGDGKLNIDAGDDDDYVSIAQSMFASAKLDGGDGEDELYHELSDPDYDNFEDVTTPTP